MQVKCCQCSPWRQKVHGVKMMFPICEVKVRIVVATLKAVCGMPARWQLQSVKVQVLTVVNSSTNKDGKKSNPAMWNAVQVATKVKRPRKVEDTIGSTAEKAEFEARWESLSSHDLRHYLRKGYLSS